jgi:hypothetical protein
MKYLLALFVLVVGCSPEVEIDTGNYPADAGESSSSSSSSSASSSSSSSGSCIPNLWSWGPDRFCERCNCPGTECRTHALGEDLVVGVCDENLKCSAKCNDPLWYEMDAGSN